MTLFTSNNPQRLTISPSLFDTSARNDVQESAFKKTTISSEC
jgi:hypothetical protein